MMLIAAAIIITVTTVATVKTQRNVQELKSNTERQLQEVKDLQESKVKFQTGQLQELQQSQEVKDKTIQELSTKLQSKVKAKEAQVELASIKVPVAAPKPVVKPAPVAVAGNIQSIIVKWANHYGVSADQLLRIARCESGFNPLARNRNYSAGAAGNPVGLFQHVEGYWPARAARYGVPGASIYDAEAQSRVTAGMFRDGQASAWECK